MRDFTEEKREELYRVLDRIDEAGLEPFRVWSGRRGYDFGEWADRLGIYALMSRADVLEQRILELNRTTRKQMEANFEGVENIDVRGADIFQEYAEMIKEQIRAVRVMTEFMESAGKSGKDMRKLLHSLTLQPESFRAAQLEGGRKVLQSYLCVRGITDPAQQQEICSLIMEEQPDLLINLYIADYYNSTGTGATYSTIMNYYHMRKKEMALMGYLERNGINDATEQQKIYGMLLKEQPDMLESLYGAVSRKEDSGTIYASIMEYYNKHKWDISVEDVEGLDLGERLDQTQKETFAACWNRLRQMGVSEMYAIAVLANIFAESRFSATNAQESAGYHGLYDDYTYEVGDSVGYGICQWTVDDRKRALQEYADSTGGSVYELETQLNYFQYEMEEGICKGLWPELFDQESRDEAVEYFWVKIEISGASRLGRGNPKYDGALATRIRYADAIQDWYETTFQKEAEEE